MRTLVVADREEIRRTVARALAERGHEVDTVGDAEIAVAACREGVFPLVIIDRDLSELDGLELCRRLRSEPGGDDRVILLLIDRARPEDAEAAIEAGSTDCLTKPIVPALLRARLAVAERQVSDRVERQHAAEALAHERDLLRALMDNLSDPIYFKDTSSRFTRLNHAMAAALGCNDPTEAIGKTDAAFYPEQLARRFLADERRILTTGLPLHNKLGPQTDGTRAGRWLLTSKAAVRDHDGRVAGIVGNAKDVTERERAAEVLAGQRRVLELVAAGAPLEETLVALCRYLEVMLPGALCSVLLLDDEGRRLRHGAAPSLPAAYSAAIDGAEIGPLAGSCGTAAYLRRPVVVEDIATDHRWVNYRELALGHGLRACWSVPIRDAASDSVLGTFAVYHREPRRPRAADLAEVIEAGHLAGVAIRSKRVDEALRDSEARFRSVVQNALDIVTILAADGTIRYESPAIERLLGYAPDELLGANALALVHPDDAEGVGSLFAGLLADPAVVVPIEFRFRHQDGTWRWLEAVGTNLLADPSVAGIVVNSRDVTERKRTELALRQSEQRAQELVAAAERHAQELGLHDRVRTALAREMELPLLFRTVVEAIAQTFGYTQVSLYLREGDHLVLQHQVGYDRVIDRVPLAEGISGRVACTSQPVLLEDVRTDPAFLGAIDGIVSEVCVPLRDQDRVVGTLNLESTGGVRLTDADLRLMVALTEHVNVAIGRARLYDQARRSEARFRALVEHASDLVSIVDVDRVRRYVSPSYEHVLGYRPDELLGRSVEEINQPDDAELDRRFFVELGGRPGAVDRMEARVLHRDGSTRWLEAIVTNRLDDPAVQGFVVNSRDVTARKEAEAALREAEGKYRTLVEQLPVVIYIGALGGASPTVYYSPQVAAMLGYAAEEFVADPLLWTQRIHSEDRQRVVTEIARAEASGGSFRMEYRKIARDGRIVWVRDEGVLVRDEAGQPRYWQGFNLDVTDRKALEARLAHEAFHDPLTGLPNRTLFGQRLADALAGARRHPGSVAVLFLDLDGFKLINDSRGHEVGDRLLVEAGRRLRGCLRSADTLARLGGDEFAVLIEGASGADEAAAVAGRLIAALRAPFVLDGDEMYVNASVGVALSTRRLASSGDLLRSADTALYQAKAAGRGTYSVFEPRMRTPVVERLERENSLRRALEREELRLHYQPKVELATGRIVGAEALVRWEHPELGLLGPNDFIGLAEVTDLIVPLGRWALREVCRQASGWQSLRPGSPPVVGVNVSAHQLREAGFVGEVVRALDESGLAPDYLDLEITETTALEDAPETRRSLRTLRKLGVRLAIDDFGTGYSSLGYLRHLAADGLKIDGSFVAGLGHDRGSVAIVRAVVTLAHELGIAVTAEAVETLDQATRLRALGVEWAQGFYFAAPMTGDAFRDLLAGAGWLPEDRPAGDGLESVPADLAIVGYLGRSPAAEGAARRSPGGR